MVVWDAQTYECHIQLRPQFCSTGKFRNKNNDQDKVVGLLAQIVDTVQA